MPKRADPFKDTEASIRKCAEAVVAANAPENVAVIIKICVSAVERLIRGIEGESVVDTICASVPELRDVLCKDRHSPIGSTITALRNLAESMPVTAVLCETDLKHSSLTAVVQIIDATNKIRCVWAVASANIKPPPEAGKIYSLEWVTEHIKTVTAHMASLAGYTDAALAQKCLLILAKNPWIGTENVHEELLRLTCETMCKSWSDNVAMRARFADALVARCSEVLSITVCMVGTTGLHGLRIPEPQPASQTSSRPSVPPVTPRGAPGAASAAHTTPAATPCSDVEMVNAHKTGDARHADETDPNHTPSKKQAR
jgi:hypothetical protein